jgi:hypothetical protein
MLDNPDVAAFEQPIVLVSQSSSAKTTRERVLGVCKVISNNGSEDTNMATYGVPVIPAAELYLDKFEKRQDAFKLIGRVVSVTSPSNGTLEVWPAAGEGSYKYLPKARFFGTDSVVAIVDLGGTRIKILWTFKVINSSIGGQLQTDMFCGKSNDFRKISSAYDIGEIAFSYGDLPGSESVASP